MASPCAMTDANPDALKHNRRSDVPAATNGTGKPWGNARSIQRSANHGNTLDSAWKFLWRTPQRIHRHHQPRTIMTDPDITPKESGCTVKQAGGGWMPQIVRLLPCPFCGADGAYPTDHMEIIEDCYCECSDEKCRTLGPSGKTWDDAGRNWNKRSSPWCDSCRETDCCVSGDGTCSMIRKYLSLPNANVDAPAHE